MAPEMDWDGLRTVLAAARAGSAAGAARALRVNETTVARRIARLEAALNAQLFDRSNGRWTLTAAGTALAEEAARMELAAEAAVAAAQGADHAVAGVVRVSAAPMIAQRLLASACPALLARYPELSLELRGDAANLRLLQRDADVAVRLARPQAEPEAAARRIGEIRYAAYGATGASDPAATPWIGYAGAFSDRAPAQWVAAAAADAGELARLSVDGAEMLVISVRAGLGKGLLPRFIGDAAPGLTRLDEDPSWRREVWLVLHPETRRLARIRAVAGWIEDVFADLRGGRRI